MEKALTHQLILSCNTEINLERVKSLVKKGADLNCDLYITPLQAITNQIVKVNVSFAYKQWYNLTTDHLAGVNFGQSRQTVHDVKGADRGLFGRLPIELQRAGREVFNSAKRQVPIGKLFKGKIFPPFT